MIGLPKKAEYALRAVFELAYRNTRCPVKIHDIAQAQAVPPRFLEGILNQLRHAGVVESRRGSDGGYLLASSARMISVADVIEIVEGVLSVAPQSKDGSRVAGVGEFALTGLWREVDEVLVRILKNTMIADLVERERNHLQELAPDYCI
ncbi:RrF2 family transcriptional regulator [Planctomycetota bacterium]